MLEDRILVFDWVGTLVPFPQLPQVARPGAAEAFQAYRKKDNKIVVASSATTNEIERGLRTVGLIDDVDLFRGVGMSPRLDQHLSQGKLYRPVLPDLSITPEEAQARMIISGDTRRDFAADLTRVVFIEEDDGNEHDMQLHSRVVEMLYDAGQGHFYEGFQRVKADRNKWVAAADQKKISFRTWDKLVHPEYGQLEVPVVTILDY